MEMYSTVSEMTEDEESGDMLESFSMMFYPFIQSMTFSHGRAAELLGVCKLDLIVFYDKMGMP